MVIWTLDNCEENLHLYSILMQLQAGKQTLQSYYLASKKLNLNL